MEINEKVKGHKSAIHLIQFFGEKTGFNLPSMQSMIVSACNFFSVCLFSTGIYGLITSWSMVIVLLCLELILNSVLSVEYPTLCN